MSYTYVSIYFDSIYSDSVLQKVGLGRTSDRVNASHSAVRLQLAVFGWSPDNNTSTLESLQDGEHITWPMIIKFPLKLDAVRSIRKPNIWNPFIACTVTHIFIEEILRLTGHVTSLIPCKDSTHSSSLVLLVPYVRALIPWVLQPPLVLAPPALSLNIKFNYCFPEQSLAPYILGTLFKASYSNVPHKKTHGHIEKEDFFELLLSVRLRS